MDLAQRAAALKDYIVQCRRHLHRHPELSFQEWNTTAFLADELRKLGIQVTTFPDYTGCIGTINPDKKGPTVALRADIDALPITEDTGLSFSSETPGVMHACGHDCHTAMLLGAARLLQEMADQLPGRVILLFQAAEEGFWGSRYYCENGYLDDAEAILGMHICPDAPLGKLSIENGNRMASRDNFRIEVQGRRADSGCPQLAQDAIVAASSCILNLQTTASRLNDPLNPLVLTVAIIKAGTEAGSIADHAVMEGTLRTYDPAMRAAVLKQMRTVVSSSAQALDCTAQVNFIADDAGDAVINTHPELTALAQGSAVKLYGEEILCHVPANMASEDFAALMAKVPGLFVFMGTKDPACDTVWPLHSEHLTVNESALPTGSAFYAQFAVDYLTQKEAR